MMMMMMGAICAPANMDYIQLRQILKQRIRGSSNSVNYKGCFSFFGPPEPIIPQRVLEESRALMPELLKIMAGSSKSKPTITTTKSKSCMNMKKSERAKKVKESRDYSFLLSDTTETLKNLKQSSEQAKDSALSNLIMPKLSCFKAKKKKKKKKNHPKAYSSEKSKSSSNSSAENPIIFKNQVSNSSNETIPTCGLMPKSQSPSQMRPIKEEEDLREDDIASVSSIINEVLGVKIKGEPVDLGDGNDNVDVSAIIDAIFGRRGKKRIRDYDDDGGDDRGMVSSFNDILKQERKSAKIARKEDAIERLRTEQEEEQERLRKQRS